MAVYTATVQSGQVSGASHTNFPSYVNLSRITGLDTLAKAQSVRVYSDAALSVELAREIVSATEMYVKIPSITSLTQIWIDYDGVRSDYAATDTYGAENVWSEKKAVFHGDNLADSAGNFADVAATSSATSNEDGKIGRAFYTPGGGQFSANGFLSANNTQSLSTSDVVYGQLWVYKVTNEQTTSTAFGEPLIEVIDSGTGDGFTFSLDSESDNANPGEPFIATKGGNNEGHNQGTVIGTGSWHMLFYVFDQPGNQLRIYTNGSLDVTTSSYTDNSSMSGSDISLYIGEAVNGSGPNTYLDEVRVFWGSELSNESGYIATQYNNQNDEAAFWGTWTDAGSGGATLGLKLGSTTINKVMLGSTEIKKIYLGSTVIYENL